MSTVNSAGVLCFPVFEKDVGWREIMEGFTDRCFPSRFLRVMAGPGQPSQWDWLESPGILCDSQLTPTVQDVWQFKQLDLTRQRTCNVQFIPDTSGATPKTQIQADLITINFIIGGPWSEQHIWTILNSSKKTPLTSTFCNPNQPPENCTVVGNLQIDWWPTCNGNPDPGPERSGI